MGGSQRAKVASASRRPESQSPADLNAPRNLTPPTYKALSCVSAYLPVLGDVGRRRVGLLCAKRAPAIFVVSWFRVGKRDVEMRADDRLMSGSTSRAMLNRALVDDE